MSFRGNKMDAVEFVKDLLEASKPSSLLITIMEQDAYGVCYVRTATDISSDDIVRMLGQACYSQLTNI